MKNYDNKLVEDFIIEALSLDNCKNCNEIVKLRSLNEEDKRELNKEVYAKIYKLIAEKYDAKDFKDIVVTNGNITKLNNYETLEATISLLESLNQKANVKVEVINELRIAMENLKRRAPVFAIGYSKDNAMTKLIYETSVYSLIISTTAVLITYVEVLKLPGNDFDLQLKNNLDTGLNNKLFLENIRRLNKMCSNGELDTSLNYFNKETKAGFNWGSLLSIAQGLWNGPGFWFVTVPTVAWFTIKFVITSVRYIVYLVYKTREDLSNWFETQKVYLEMNINLQEINNGDPRVIEKQKIIARNLEKLAAKLRVELKVSDNEVINDIKKEDKGIQADTLLI